MKKFDTVKLAVRGIRVGPMHDCDVCDFSGERAFWMYLTDKDGEVVGLQAFRCDFIDTSLADWLPNYMIGVYMRRQVLMVPSHAKPPLGSVSERLRGRLVYHGEIWLAKTIKGRNVFDGFTRLGLLISHLKWNPEATWGLASEQMAKHGHMTRVGYAILERGILRWHWYSEGIDAVEYLTMIEKSSLENIIDEMQSTPMKSELVSASPLCNPQLSD